MHEAQIETTPDGKLPAGAGWFILNLGDMAWETVPGLGVWRGFDDRHPDPPRPGKVRDTQAYGEIPDEMRVAAPVPFGAR